MTYDDLTDDQRSQIQAFMDVFRPTMGQLARVLATLAKLEDAWLSVGPVVNALNDGSPIKTTTGLAGTVELAKENLVGSMDDFQTALNAFNTPMNRARYIAAAGLANVV